MISLIALLFHIPFSSADSTSTNDVQSDKRVPAEWERQEAMWLQWPGPYEKEFEVAFARMTRVISDYEKLHILYDTKANRQQAYKAISAIGGSPEHKNITWHSIAYDNAWMRDNGPVYIIENGEMRIQNWSFDAWGGAFGDDVTYTKDNLVPIKIGEYLKIPVDNIKIVHERGNLEFNGIDTVILNWSTIGDPRRNVGLTKTQVELDLKRHFGVSKVVFIEGVTQGDLTNGHIDGIARFINPTTVVVPDCTSSSKCQPDDGLDDGVYDAAATTIESAGFRVIRDPIEGVVSAGNYTLDTNYLNWIVGNGFVIVVGFDDVGMDAAAKSRIESYFPNRDVHVIPMLKSWVNGGGAHCHTNDQPAASTISFTNN